MSKWTVSFMGSVEVEAEDKEGALTEAAHKFNEGDHADAEPDAGWCDYCENGAATVSSPYWLDGKICQRCHDELKVENEESAEDSE